MVTYLFRAALIALLAFITFLFSYWIVKRRAGLALLKALSDIPELPNKYHVSIIVPVRNGAKSISKCIESLLRQRKVNYEVIVVDDCSEDSTDRILEKYAVLDKVTVISVRDIPEGWAGKNWACHLGYLSSKGEVLVFIDSDTLLLDDEAILKALNIMNIHKASVLSLYPKFRLETIWEKVWIPFSANFMYILVHLSKVNEPGDPTSFLLGAFTVFKRDAYEGVGGHSVVKGELAEDKALGERVKMLGYRFMLAYGGDLISTRWGGGLRESWNGMKRVVSFSVKSCRALIAASGIMAAIFLLPLIAFASSLIANDLPLLTASIAPIALTVLLESMELIRNGEPPITALAYPAAAAFAIANMLYMACRFKDVEIEWKGRRYRVKASS